MVSPSNVIFLKALHWPTPVTWSLLSPLIGHSTGGQNWVHQQNHLCVGALHFDPWCTLNLLSGQHQSHHHFPGLSSYWGYNPHRLRDSLSPVCGISFINDAFELIFISLHTLDNWTEKLCALLNHDLKTTVSSGKETFTNKWHQTLIIYSLACHLLLGFVVFSLSSLQSIKGTVALSILCTLVGIFTGTYAYYP